MTMVSIDHVLLTRFNLPSVGPESLIRAQDGWLRDRVELFERHTVPSVRAQSAAARVHWLVFLDRESPRWLIERLTPLVDEGLLHPVFGEQFTNDEVVAEARALTGGTGDVLLTTNLDNDDALAVDFAERLHQLVTSSRTEALYLSTGIILTADEAYLRHDPHNAFVSVVEPWEDAKTVWRDWHNRLHLQMPVRVADGAPAWLQVIHGRNVSNRVRGKLIDAASYRDCFPGQLDAVRSPTRGGLLRDRLVRVPLRAAKESVRRLGKTLVMALFGKDGLDRVKERLQRRSAT